MGAVKSKAPNRITSAPVVLVADDRVTALGQMHAYLMFPARFQPNFHESGLGISLHHVDVRHSELPDSSVGRGVHLVRGILGKVGLDRKVVRFNASFDDGHVSTSGAMI